MKKNKIKKNVTKNGFSIGEVMLSVFILGTTLITITTLFSKSSTELIDNRDSVIAAMLAQEGIEIARNNRDTNWITGSTGDTFEDITIGAVNCLNGLMYLGNDISGGYVCGNGKFKRKVSSGIGIDTRTITSMVVWKGASFPSINNCTVTNNCVYSQAIFSTWGDN